MPSSTVTRFTPVAAQYLRNLDELEAAREMFHVELAKILDELAAVTLEAATARKHLAEGRCRRSPPRGVN